jgi:3-mercaptopyruvate sulfurtransferase SseA
VWGEASPVKTLRLILQVSLRARRDQNLQILEKKNAYLVDVPSPDEFAGKIIGPPGMTETAQRARKAGASMPTVTPRLPTTGTAKR